MKLHDNDGRNAYDCNPGALLDTLQQRARLPNDAALCRVLDIQPSLISKIRHGKQRLSADIVLRIHDTFNMPVAEIRQLMGAAPWGRPYRRDASHDASPAEAA